VPRDQPYPLVLQPGILSIDQLLWMAQEKVREVYARTRNLASLNKADAWWIMLTFESGLVGVIEQSYWMPDIRLLWCDVHFEAVGTQATYQFHEPNDATWLWTKEVTSSPDFYLIPELFGRYTGALVDQMAYFADCLTRGERPTIGTLAEAREALRVGLAVTQSAAQGAPVRLGA
jgi:predicted dehydrogenase